jgi:HEPN domain-containing protein
MNRDDLRKVAELRIAEAEVLLQNRHFEGAYYLAGYAVECALKACIASITKEHDFPDKKRVNDSYSHDLERLAAAAQLKVHLDSDIRDNRQFRDNWNTVKDWSEETRYVHGVSEATARELIEAITEPTNGVMQWVRKWW